MESTRYALSHGRFIPFVSALAVASAFTLGCKNGRSASGRDGSQLSGKLMLTGSSTVGPLAMDIARRFERLHPRVRIEVQTGGSSRGIADAASGTADIGMSSRALHESEQAAQRAWPLAMDGVAFIVHADNPVRALDAAALRAIYTGETDNWTAFGGRDAPITVIDRAAGRSEVEMVREYLGLKPDAVHADLIAGENQQGIKMIAKDRNAITYLSVGASAYEAEAGTPIKLLPLDGVPASIDNVAASRFPLVRPLIFVTRPKPTALAQAFIDYARSPAVDDLVREFAYVPLAR